MGEGRGEGGVGGTGCETFEECIDVRRVDVDCDVQGGVVNLGELSCHGELQG